MQALLRLSRAIDWLNSQVGKYVLWLILASTVISGINAVVRKVFNYSSNAFLEVQWYLFAAAFLLAAGAKGKRFALPNSQVMIRQPLGGTQGQATEIEIHAREILKTRERLNTILAERTGQSLEKIQHDTERDYFLSALEAKEYGLVDQVLDKRP